MKTPTPLCLGMLFVWALGPLHGAPRIVINEIHYDPEPKTEHVEFIELFNAGDETADLSGWRFSDGVEYAFPDGTELASGAYLILTENKSHYDRKFAGIFAGGQAAFDIWNGTLRNSGETLRLVDGAGMVMDEVDYKSEFPWPIGANGDGVSMELIHPDADNDLGGHWRSASGAPTPGKQNTAFLQNPPPPIRQVSHAPDMPGTGEETVITAKVTDADGVQAVALLYQVVNPGAYLQAFLAKSSGDLRNRPNDPREPNPEFEAAENWQSIPMLDDGSGADATAGDDIFSATLPAQALNRTLVRYRILATDTEGASARAPYPDDPSLNFAYFVYDGVPPYTASQTTVHPDGAPYTYPREVMTSLPVYFLLTDKTDFDQCIAYNSADQIPRDNYDARSAFNWSGTFIYDGVVYDNIRYRLRQRNARYSNQGKRSMRFRFNRGNHVQFHDLWGNPYPEKWRTLNSSKMHARGGYNYGLHEAMNNRLWNLVGVPAPETHWFHLRVVKARDEVPPGSIFGPNQNAQYTGDFFGLHLALEDYDSRFLDAHDLPDNNLYKLISGRTDGKDVQRVQGKFSVDDASDFSHILQNLRPARDAEWLETYVDYDHYSRYHAIVECVRHYDVQPNLSEHLKNRAFYFADPTPENPFGRLQTLPWDSDTSWGPNWNAGIDYAADSLLTDKEDREALQIRYYNTIREVRDLVWQPDQIDAMLDRLAAKIGPFVEADRDRWRNAPSEAGSDNLPPFDDKVADMKRFAWDGGPPFWEGGNDPIGESRDSGISGAEGRDAYLDHITKGGQPTKPIIAYTGEESFPADGLLFESSDYKTSLFAGQPFAAMEWRVAEVTDPSLPDYDPSAPFLWEWNATWESGKLPEFQKEIVIPPIAVRSGRTYRARVRMTDVLGRQSNWSDPVEFTAGDPSKLATIQTDLRISEIMYHPTSATPEETALGYSTADFEYIELYNAGAEALDLRGLRFTKGIDFDFDGASITSLEAGAVLLVVRHREAFEHRHGSALPIAGEYRGNNESRLNDSGDRLKLSFGGGTPIFDFEFDDEPPWPTAADGEGLSLQLANLREPGSLADPAAWTTGTTAGGDPGRVSDPVAPTDPDSDGDGQSDASEVLAGTDPQDPQSVLAIVAVTRDSAGVLLEWSSVAGKTYQIEQTTDPQSPSWTVIGEQVGAEGETSFFEDLSKALHPQNYYRIRVKN